MDCKVFTYSLLAIALVVVFTSCEKREAGAFDDTPHGTITIAHLKTLSTESSTILTDDIAIEGYITANDLYGELYKSIYICDDSGGIELSVDCNKTAVTFPVGARIIVHCATLALGDYGGQLILGAPPTGDYVVDRIDESRFDTYFTIDRTKPKMVAPKEISLADLAPQHIGNYVHIKDVNFGSQAGLKWCETDPETGEYITTERELYGDAGNKIIVRIDGRCSYAEEQIPSGRGAIGAIAEYFNGVYQLRIINRNIYF